MQAYILMKRLHLWYKRMTNYLKGDVQLSKAKKPYGTVLLKAVKILDFLSQRAEAVTMTEISENTEITLSTTNKILDTLLLIGLVARDDVARNYTLGPRLFQFANASLIQFDIARETFAPLKHLHEIVGTTVNLGKLDNNQVLFINKFTDRESSKKVVSRIGITQPLYSTAMGKAILADFSEEELAEYFETIEFSQLTGQTINSKEDLILEIEDTRKRGYGIDDSETEENVYCIGKVVHISDLNTRFAFSISSQKDDLSEERISFLVDEMEKSKNVIEYQLK